MTERPASACSCAPTLFDPLAVPLRCATLDRHASRGEWARGRDHLEAFVRADVGAGSVAGEGEP